MASAGSIYVDLLLNDGRYIQGLNRSRQATSAAAAAWQRDVNRTRDSFTAIINPVNNISKIVTGLSGLFASAFSVHQIAQYSDEWKSLEGRLNLISDSSAELAQSQDRLSRIAQDTRSDLGATVTLYQRLSSAVKGLGIEQDDVFKFTEQLNKQLITAGLSSNEAAAAVYQLTQAFNKGKLDGDEFRTILESAPPILEALQTSLGKTRGEILQMASDGKLAPRVLVDAVNEMSAVTDARFSKFQLTIRQAFQELDNSSLKFVGTSTAVQTSAGLTAEAIEGLAGWLDNLVESSISVESMFAGIGVRFLDLAQSVQQFRSDNAHALGLDSLAGEYQTSANLIKKHIDDIGDYLVEADEKRRHLNDNTVKKGINPVVPVGPSDEDLKKTKQLQNELDSLYEKNETYITGLSQGYLSYSDSLDEVTKLFDNGRISADQYYTALENIDAEFDQSSKKAGVWSFDIEEAGKQASRNIQDSFADFLFDPFAKGLGGMVEGFANTMRRMIAEATAAKILGALFGEDGLSFVKGPSAKSGSDGGGFLSKIFDGFFAEGGLIKPGHFGIAGEAGAELIYGGNTGATVIPQKAFGSGVVFNHTYVFQPGVSRADLAQIIPQIQKGAEDNVLEKINRGGRFSQAVGRRT